MKPEDTTLYRGKSTRRSARWTVSWRPAVTTLLSTREPTNSTGSHHTEFVDLSSSSRLGVERMGA
ncbi:hypothetical protein MINT15_16050 [Saccharomonospora viridis]|uniref:Uncharacterized protein n=1 Tax=Saccharomonospora viridis TaxID=1852 RepID=A0A837DA70_9PSEU|nr:hypothetical protein MINT15_16050 [Saccharomonospora viridis]